MTGNIWKEWLKKIDRQMRARKRKIVMLRDNCAAHNGDIQLANVKVVFMPPNTTSLIQPMDQGIIANFKRHYRSLVLRQLMGVIETTDDGGRAAELARKLTLLDSMHMQKEAWSRVTTSTIINCYRRASFVKDTSEAATDTEEGQQTDDDDVPVLPAGVTSEEFNQYVAVDNDLQTTADSTDAELCSDQQPAAAGEAEESDGEPSQATDGDQPPAVTFTTALQSLFNVRSYLEAAGCDDYEHFYGLTDQLYAISRQQAVQKTIKDFFK